MKLKNKPTSVRVKQSRNLVSARGYYLKIIYNQRLGSTKECDFSLNDQMVKSNAMGMIDISQIMGSTLRGSVVMLTSSDHMNTLMQVIIGRVSSLTSSILVLLTT